NLGDFREGLNDRGEVGFAPAAPPPGHGRHRYHFQLFALDKELSLPGGVDYARLLQELKGHVIAWSEIVGVYERL
ncbi:MAG TPA: YbhB/YbcL family Raf kinase inhibitor-like protein, partial [Polyangiaceae bacterium]|nr:YbhB/YbcL family Raf kinase inhibitor-like protein [Polyangiaceae bacterium]